MMKRGIDPFLSYLMLQIYECVEKGKMRKELYLTFDMDWAIDEVLADFYSLIKKLSVVGTIHVTHETNFLNLFRKDNILDCGIHPNYNFCLGGGGG